MAIRNKDILYGIRTVREVKLEELEKINRTHNVYVSVNPLKEDARRRTKDNVREIKHVFLDFDGEAQERIAAMLKSGRVPRHNEVIHTSPGKSQVLWRVEGFSKEAAESLSRGLSREFGADTAATDCARIMRLPGFRNHKYDPPQYVSSQYLRATVYRPEHFPVYTQEQEHAQVRPYVPRAVSGKGITQSEKDWAYTRRALAFGVSPEEIREKLEYERRHDKPNPRAYAETTVRNAMASRSR